MLVRVLEIPAAKGDFCFSGGNPQTFVEVDWFRDDEGMLKTDDGKEVISNFIQGKKYFSADKSYLVLAQEGTFVINYTAA